MKSYLSCVIQDEAIAPEATAPETTLPREDREGCVGACSTTVYRHDLSTTPLSEAVVSYFEGANLETLKGRYQEAQEVKQRVTGRYLPDVLNQIIAVEDSLKDIDKLLTFTVSSKKTSLFKRIDSAVAVLLSRVEQDMASLYADIDVYQQAYKTNLALDRETLVTILRDVIDIVSQVRLRTLKIVLLYGDANDALETLRQIDIGLTDLEAAVGNSTELLHIVFLTSGFIDACHVCEHAMAAVELPATLVHGKEPREACSRAWWQEYDDSIVDFIRSNVTGLLRTFLDQKNTEKERLANASDEVVEGTTSDPAMGEHLITAFELHNATSNINIDNVSSSYMSNLMYTNEFILQYQDNIESLIKCLSSYSTFLQTVETNRDNIKGDIHFKKLTGRYIDNPLNEIKMLRREIKDVYRKYSSLEMTKLEMELTLSERVNQTFWSLFRDIEGHLERSYVAPRLSKFDELKDTLLTAYMTGLHDVIELGEYFSQPEARGIFTDRAKALYLWREPVANLDSAERVIPRQNTYYGDVTIPNVASFLKTNGQERIQNILEDFFRGLSLEMDAFQSFLLKQRLQLEDSFEDLQGNLRRFHDAAQIDVEFVRRNILRLDVYFSQLQEEKITQTVAYDLPDFGGDLGGYMGLFLGASALSVVEVLDWLIYKIMKRRRDASRTRPPPQDATRITMQSREKGCPV